MNKIIWYRDTVFKNFCYVSFDNVFYYVNQYGNVVSEDLSGFYIEIINEEQILELNEYKILKLLVLKITSNLYQELMK